MRPNFHSCQHHVVNNFKKNGNSVLPQEYSGNKGQKRKRAVEFHDIHECVVKSIKTCQNNNVSLGGELVKEKAQMFAQSLRHNEFIFILHFIKYVGKVLALVAAYAILGKMN